MSGSKTPEQFFDAYEALCREYGYSLSHEDTHGAFLLERLDEQNLRWARAALQMIPYHPLGPKLKDR